jgi:hypothetical protein
VRPKGPLTSRAASGERLDDSAEEELVLSRVGIGLPLKTRSRYLIPLSAELLLRN